MFSLAQTPKWLIFPTRLVCPSQYDNQVALIHQRWHWENECQCDPELADDTDGILLAGQTLERSAKLTKDFKVNRNVPIRPHYLFDSGLIEDIIQSLCFLIG